MPPAFNLSQDQTLQFNLCFSGIAAGGRSLKILTNHPKMITFILCEHLMLYVLSFGTEVPGTSSNAHTYRLLIVKEFFAFQRCRRPGWPGDKSLCLSAAEKRYYAMFRAIRQASHQLTSARLFHFHDSAVAARDRTISKPV